MTIAVQDYLTADGVSPFARWFATLNARAALKVRTAIARMEGGNLSNTKSVGAGVFECRIDFGPGYGFDGNSMSPEKSTNKVIGSPNRVPWMLCTMLGRLAAETMSTQKRSLVEQNGLVAIFLGINTIEAFANIFFRVVAEESQFAHARAHILRDLENRHFPLHKKLRDWPQLAFNQTIDEDDSRWKCFISLRNRRNAFMHFKSTHETVVLPDNVIVTGLADLSPFAELDEETPRNTLTCVKEIVEAVAECRGVEMEQLPGFIHGWLGILE